ncbi:MAG: methyltransferase domain-containing protein, partial [Deltaproteobacteria bacterium]
LLPLMDQGYDLVAGSRVMTSPDQKLKVRAIRKFIGGIFNLLARLLLPTGIKDTQCGFKMMNAEAAETLFYPALVERFGFDLEILYAAKKAGLKVLETPISWQHERGSKVNFFTDPLSMVFDMLRIRWRYRKGYTAVRAETAKLSSFYDHDRSHGAEHSDINAGQYGIKGETIVNPARYRFFYQKLLGTASRLVEEGDSVIDVGCGMGLLGKLTAGRTRLYVGVDISVERARQAMAAVTEDRRFFVVADARRLPFKEGVFSKAVSLEVIEHVPETDRFLKEVNRVLMPGGQFILSTPGSLSYTDNSWRLYHDQHIYEFNRKSVASALVRNDFLLQKVRGAGFKVQVKVPLWLGSDALKFVYSKMTGARLNAGYGHPVSVEFDIVSSRLMQGLYARNKAVWSSAVRALGAVGSAFPGLASSMLFLCRKE